MPQLDKVSFFSQYFWLFFFFSVFYIFSHKYFLPHMGRVLKYRSKRLSQSHQGVSNMLQENTNVRESVENLLENGLQNSKQLLLANSQGVEDWLLGYTKESNQSTHKETNSKYLYLLGERSLSEKLSIQASSFDFASRLYICALIKQIQKIYAKESVNTWHSKSNVVYALQSGAEHRQASQKTFKENGESFKTIEKSKKNRHSGSQEARSSTRVTNKENNRREKR